MPDTLPGADGRWPDPRRLLPAVRRRYLASHEGLAALFDHLDRHGPARAPAPRRAAEIARCGSATLKRRFRLLGAGTPARFVKRWRLRCARRLLRNPFLAVKQVAHRCGLPNPSAFSRDFQAEFGVSPTEYRRRRLASRDAADRPRAALQRV